jgi:hypothetical protein
MRIALVFLLVKVAAAGGDALAVARNGPVASDALAYAESFFERPDHDVLAGLVAVLADQARSEQDRFGAYLMLLTLSGRNMPPDAMLWRSYVRATRETYKPPPEINDGNVAAAAARGARFVRTRLATRHGIDAVGLGKAQAPGYSIALSCLAVLALRAAGTPRDDDVIVATLRRANAAYPRPPDRLGHWTRADPVFDLSFLLMAMDGIGDTKRETELAHLLVQKQSEAGCWSGAGQLQPFGTMLALAALRSAQRAGATIPQRTWARARAYWRRTANRQRGWCPEGDRFRYPLDLCRVASGIAGIRLCAERGKSDDELNAALQRLGRGLKNGGYTGSQLRMGRNAYALERACSATLTQAFAWPGHRFDWYEVGARMYLHWQSADGSWGSKGPRWSREESTSFAILFLTRGSPGRTRSRTGQVVTLASERAR